MWWWQSTLEAFGSGVLTHSSWKANVKGAISLPACVVVGGPPALPTLSLSLSSNSTQVNGDVLTSTPSFSQCSDGGGALASTCVYVGVGSCFLLVRPVFFSHSSPQVVWVLCGWSSCD
jgi:hypothetical protein